MHYNIALEAEKYFFFLLKKYIHYGNGDGVGIPEPVGDGDEIWFLIPAKYK